MGVKDVLMCIVLTLLNNFGDIFLYQETFQSV